MGFEFALAAVLRIRQMVEEREERLLHQIVLEIHQTTENLECTSRKITATYASMGQDLISQEEARPSVGHELHAAYGEVRELIDARKGLEAHLEKLQQLRDKQRIVYDAAHRDREMLTDLRQESRNAYDQEMARREQKSLDDNYIARRNRS